MTSARILVAAPAGHGKTTRVVAAVRRLVEQGDRAGRFRRFVVLVPTYSAAEHLKRRLLRGQGGRGALLDRGIGTFEQLAERETGVRLHSLAPPAVQVALMGRALESVDDELLTPVARFPGLRTAALRFVKELKSQEGDVRELGARLAAGADELPAYRRGRTEALARVVPVYQDELDRAGLLDHEDLLRLLLTALRERNGASGDGPRLDLFAADGFADLTEVQTRIVHTLVESAEQSIVTLLDEPGGSGDDDSSVFAAAQPLRGALIAGAGFEVEPPGGERRLHGVLDEVERGERGAVAGVPPAVPRDHPPRSALRVLIGADPTDEADRVARRCRALAAEGVARSEILIVVRDTASETATRVVAALRRHRVPHRCRQGVPLISVPSARVAYTFLQLVADPDPRRSGRHAEAVLASGSARDVDGVEADLVVHGAGRERTLADLARDAAGRPTVLEWLVRLTALRARLHGREPAETSERAAAVRETVAAALGALPSFVSVACDERLPAPEDEWDAALDAAALRRLRESLLHALAAARVSGTPEASDPSAVIAAAQSAAATLRVRPRDRRVDVVNVVGADEARTWEARVAIVVGLRMGEFPGGAREDVFVADADRDRLARAAGVRLPRRLDRALSRERQLFYSAVTRANERLILTTSTCDTRGEPVARSPFLTALLDRLGVDGGSDGDDASAAGVTGTARPDLHVEHATRAPGDVVPATGETFGERDLWRVALADLCDVHGRGERTRRLGRRARTVLSRVATDLSPAHPLVRAGASRAWREAHVPPGGRAAARLSRPRARSASALESFARCPFQHFAQRVLDLEASTDDDAPRPNALEQGNVLHLALERLHATGGPPPGDDAGLRAFVDAAWDELVGDVPPTLLRESVRAALREAVVAAVRTDAERAPAPFGGFGAGAAAEVPFGGDGPEVLIGETVRLVGRIDRLDREDDGLPARAVVVDYKWSTPSTYSSLGRRIDEGSRLQLPLYVLAAEQAFGVRVAAAAYRLLKKGAAWRWLKLDASLPGKAHADWSEDRDERLAAFTQRLLGHDAAIRFGDVAVRPRDDDACAYCDFGDVCRVEMKP